MIFLDLPSLPDSKKGDIFESPLDMTLLIGEEKRLFHDVSHHVN